MTARHDKATPFNGTRDPRDIRTYYTSEVAYLRSIQRRYACSNCATATGMCSSCKRLDARIKELEATDKATEGRTEAAAVDQAIADVEHWVREQTNPLSTPRSRTEAKERGRAALRVLADAVAELREYEAQWHELQTPEFIDYWFHIGKSCSAGEAVKDLLAERVRLARQVADLEAALREYDDIWDDMLRGVSITHVANRIHRARAALAAARPRDPQEPQT